MVSSVSAGRIVPKGYAVRSTGSDEPVDFRGELTQAGRNFPSRIDPCLNLVQCHRRARARVPKPHGCL